jgi:tripartite-type tricarboxylate transporter receptor subunit TctC
VVEAAAAVRIAAIFWLVFCAATACAQDYPARPVHVVVAFSPGGVTDVIARAVGAKLAELWRQPVIVENRAGANGSIAAALVAKAAPDGHVLLVHSAGYATNAALGTSLAFDPAKDLAPVAPLGAQPQVLVVAPASGIASVEALIARAKAAPGMLHYGSAGIGSGAHLNAEKFRLATGIDVVHVPYKGGAEAIQDTIAGRLDFTFNTLTLALPHLRDGRLAALGVSSARRTALLPQVPTIAEAGVPGFEYSFWNGLWAPAATPPAVLDRIAADVARAIAAPELAERLAKLGAEPMHLSREEFARFVQAEIEDAARITRAAGMKPQ